MWFRVFGTSAGEPAPVTLLEHLHGLGLGVTGHFHGDEQGWFRAELLGGPLAAPLVLERFLAAEEGIRAELNNWAAWIESTGEDPNQALLMRHMIASQQLFTLHLPGGPKVKETVQKIGVPLCQVLAEQTDGVFQMDGEGFFDASGTLLLRE
jgi:hypothetical protein